MIVPRRPIDPRVLLLASAFFGVLAILMTRLWYVQGVEAPRLAKRVLGDRMLAERGRTEKRVCRDSWLIATDHCPETETWTFPTEESFLRTCPLSHGGAH